MMQEKKITCFIIDDEKPVADRLNHLVKDFTNLEILGVETDPVNAVSMVAEKTPDIVFLDVEMPEMSGFELIEAIRFKSIFPAFIFVTAFDHYGIKAVKESAFDYLLKPVDIDELKECINRFNKKRNLLIRPEDINLPLNPREKEVVALLIKGLTSKEIAEKLFISKTTVETHRQNIRQKTGAKNIAELVSIVLQG
jgi:DNA-binding NarL/FixJ family response regulator